MFWRLLKSIEMFVNEKFQIVLIAKMYLTLALQSTHSQFRLNVFKFCGSFQCMCATFCMHLISIWEKKHDFKSSDCNNGFCWIEYNCNVGYNGKQLKMLLNIDFIESREYNKKRRKKNGKKEQIFSDIIILSDLLCVTNETGQHHSIAIRCEQIVWYDWRTSNLFSWSSSVSNLKIYTISIGKPTIQPSVPAFFSTMTFHHCNKDGWRLLENRNRNEAVLRVLL